MTNAALYLRSSKDRHDLSLSAQRQALHDAARERGLVVAAEFADAVESGKDEERPGFQQLLASLRDKARGWSVLLVLDTSRLARRRHLALIFEHEAERAVRGRSFVMPPDPESEHQPPNDRPRDHHALGADLWLAARGFPHYHYHRPRHTGPE